MSESAWLIERVKSDGTVYAPAQYFSDDNLAWTTDHMKAIRFCRQVDADRVRNTLRNVVFILDNQAETRAIEHQWV